MCRDLASVHLLLRKPQRCPFYFREVRASIRWLGGQFWGWHCNLISLSLSHFTYQFQFSLPSIFPPCKPLQLILMFSSTASGSIDCPSPPSDTYVQGPCSVLCCFPNWGQTGSLMELTKNLALKNWYLKGENIFWNTLWHFTHSHLNNTF